MPPPGQQADIRSGVSTSPSKSELQRSDAERLDRRIRLMAVSIGDSLSKLCELVEQAKAGNIHVALGFSSWTAYVADACKVQIRVDRDQRRELVGWLSGEGMSQRAIADVVGINKNTVTSDLSQVSQFGTPADELAEEVLADARADGGADGDLSRENVAPAVTAEVTVGLDDKTYSRSHKAPQRKPITDDTSRLALDLRKITARINKLLDDDRFDRNREQIANGLAPYDEWLATAADGLHRALRGGGS